MRPLLGIPLLFLVLYFFIYRFVGVFAAGTVVDYLEIGIFQAHINPCVDPWTAAYIPWPAISDLLAGDYGIVTLGLRYAAAIILPITGCYFLAFSLIEDSGYLPRMALLLDRLFKRLGLSGRAIIPLVLGFGCGTMATVVTRTLETKRERLIATVLLALAIPCSAQLGIILSLLAAEPQALAIWAAVVLAVFLLAGCTLNRVLPGDRPVFYLEVPPLRIPRLENVLAKTFTRLRLYFVEIVPLFALASFVIWFAQMVGLYDAVIRCLWLLAGILGLPPRAGEVLLFGFLRRDYGAAGLHDLVAQGVLGVRQMAVLAVILTLSVPCAAQLVVIVKERGLVLTGAIVLFVCFCGFGTAYVLNFVLRLLGLA